MTPPPLNGLKLTLSVQKLGGEGLDTDHVSRNKENELFTFHRVGDLK